MVVGSESAERRGHRTTIRLGGLAILLAFVIHFLVNFVLKEFPPESATDEEFRAYLATEAGTWAVVHGLRYVAFPCIVLFASGLFMRTCGGGTSRGVGWGVVGLLGTAILVTNGLMTNGLETLAFLNIELLSRRQELFWLLFRVTRVLFTGEIVAWALLMLGFSVAAWLSTTIPKWLGILGFAGSAAGLASGVFIVSVLAEGWAAVLLDIAALSGLAWFASVGVYMMIRGESKQAAV